MKRNACRGIERPVDLLDRPAFRLKTEQQEHQRRLRVPEGEEQQGREQRRRHDLGTDVIGRTDDECKSERSDDLAEIADAIAEAHAAGAQPVGPDFGDVGADDRVAGIAEKALRHDEQEEYRYCADVNGGGRARWQKASASPQQVDYLPSNPSSLQCLDWHSASAVSWSEASGLWSARRSIPEHQKFVDHQMESSACRRGRLDHPAVKRRPAHESRPAV